MHDPTSKFSGMISPRTEKVAKLLSLIGQPPFLSIIPFVAICIAFSDELTSGIACSTAAVFAAVVLPIVNIVFFSKKYNNSDKLDVEKKEDRLFPLIAGVIGYAVGVVLLYFLEAPWLATGLITPFWKISIHSCGVIGPTMGLAVAFWPFGILYILLLPPIAWSRYVLKKHTSLQLAMGAVVGFILTALIFWILL